MFVDDLTLDIRHLFIISPLVVDIALRELEHQLNSPSQVGPGCALLDPRYDPIRGHPEFERIVADALTENE